MPFAMRSACFLACVASALGERPAGASPSESGVRDLIIRATTFLEQAKSASPDQPVDYYYLAEVLEWQHDDAGAIEHYRQFIAADKGSMVSLEKHAQERIADLSLSIEARVDDRAQRAFSSGDYKGAAEELGRVSHPVLVGTQLLRAGTALQVGDSSTARQIYMQIASSGDAPGVAEAEAQLAIIDRQGVPLPERHSTLRGVSYGIAGGGVVFLGAGLVLNLTANNDLGDAQTAERGAAYRTASQASYATGAIAVVAAVGLYLWTQH